MLPSDISAYLTEMDANDPSEIHDHQFADTARRAYAHLGNNEKMRAAAQRVLALTANDEGVNDPHIRRAIREARSAAALPETHKTSAD